MLPLSLTPDEIETILKPYQDIAHAIQGFKTKRSVQEPARRLVIWDFSTIDGAKELYRKLADRSIEAVARYEDIVAARAAAADAAMTVSWELSRRP